MMSLIALPLIVGATREALQAIPRHVREASYALGKDEDRDDPARAAAGVARAGSATGATLGMGRIAGDTAIVVILLGASLQLQPESGDARSSARCRGTGSTLTSYVYNNSPAGEGNAPEKAYAAAFVLLMIVIVLNFAVDLIARGRSDRTRMEHAPSRRRPSRRIVRRRRSRRVVAPPPAPNGTAATRVGAAVAAPPQRAAARRRRAGSSACGPRS